MLARAYLSRVAEAPAPALTRLVDALGPVEAAERVRSGRVPEPVAAETSTRRAVDRAQADLDAAAALRGVAAHPGASGLAELAVRGLLGARGRGAHRAAGALGARPGPARRAVRAGGRGGRGPGGHQLRAAHGRGAGGRARRSGGHRGVRRGDRHRRGGAPRRAGRRRAHRRRARLRRSTGPTPRCTSD